METTRIRIASAIEWALAAVLVVGACAAGVLGVREFRTVTAVTPVIAHESSPPVPPASVPPRVVSVSLLLLPNGTEVHIGDTASEVASRLDASAVPGAETFESTHTGDRVTRAYYDHGMHFLLVFESVESNPEGRVTAIYLQ